MIRSFIRPCKYHLPLTTNHSPLTTKNFALTNYHLPLTSYHFSLTTYHLPFISYHLPLTTYHLQLTTCPLLLTTYHLPLGSSIKYNLTFSPPSLEKDWMTWTSPKECRRWHRRTKIQTDTRISQLIDSTGKEAGLA